MIPHPFSATRSLRCKVLRATVALSLLGLAAVSSVRAATVGLEPSTVTPNDTFSFEITGYNTNFPTQGAYLVASNLTPTFGTTANYPNAVGNQTLTVQSVEYVNSGVVYDLINISVPTNFVNPGSTDGAGHNIDAIRFSIGNYRSPSQNTLDFNQPLSLYTVSGTIVFNFNGVNASQALDMTTTLSNGNRSLTTYGDVFATPQGTGDIYNNQVNAFTLLISYPVPEPSTYATVALGVAGLFLVLRRRRASL